MIIILSGGPIFEPMLGFAISGVCCLIFLVIFIFKVKRTDLYLERFVPATTSNKILYILAFFLISLGFLFILFYILGFIFSGILISALK